ncbi:DUF3467 domain-containing protein [bacterium]|nr:DUF3467 domain-containing protein [bacterium]
MKDDDQKPEPGKEPPRPPQPPAFIRRPYCSAARINHTGLEFVVDFGDVDPDHPGTVAFSCGVKMSPQTAKCVMHALRQAIAKYEEQFGKIGFPPDEAPPRDWQQRWN